MQSEKRQEKEEEEEEEGNTTQHSSKGVSDLAQMAVGYTRKGGLEREKNVFCSFSLSLFRLQRRTERGFAAAACAAVGDPFLEHRALTHSPCACVQHPHLSLLRESKEENERRRAARHQAQGKPSRRRGRVI